MIQTIAFVTGLLAVGFFLLSYLQKKRRSILVFNLTSRILYIAQYLLLGAFEGAVLDVLGAASTALAQKRSAPWLARWWRLALVGINAIIIGAGLLLYQNVFSLLPIVGVLLQTDALWLKDERKIRLISMAGCPFWFTYNFVSGAYGSCVGDLLALISLGISFVRYDLLKRNQASEQEQAQ